MLQIRFFLTLAVLSGVAAIPVAPQISVALRVYYESLCPSSQDFIRQLDKAAPGLADILDLSLFPYGNAHPTPANATCGAEEPPWRCNVSCQHGMEECKRNLEQACLLHFVGNARVALPAVQCILNSAFPLNWCVSKYIPNSMGLPKQVAECMNSPLGEQVQQEMATATLIGLIPPKQFVPWVTVDQAPLGEGYKEFVAAVCTAYRVKGGLGPPPACTPGTKGFGSAGGAHPARPSPNAHNDTNRTILITRCKTLRVLGEVCLSVYAQNASKSSDPETFGVVLQFSRPGLPPRAEI